MITKHLKLKVIDEATGLKTCATQEELKKLDFNNLRPQDRDRCIYGQMTGSCFSERATELLNCCAVPYSSELEYYRRTKHNSFTEVNRQVYTKSKWVFSAIETYICKENAKSNNLIDYLKGVKETLTVEDL